MSEKENTSDTKDSVNNSSSESKMNTSPVINPAIQVRTSKSRVRRGSKES